MFSNSHYSRPSKESTEKIKKILEELRNHECSEDDIEKIRKQFDSINSRFVNLTPTLSERLAEKIGGFLKKLFRKGERNYE